jgi:hypothetical protein
MPIPYIPQGTSRRFKVPRTLAADFDAFLNRDIPNTVMNFEILKCWYDKFKDDYYPQYVRGEIYPDSTKSRYENTDNNLNIRCSVSSGIRKGDMLIQPDGTIFILDWEVALQSNNAPSRALRCNMMLRVKRYCEQEDQYDEDGYLMHDREDPWQEIVSPIPCNAYRYDGRPEYVVVSGTPGATPSALTLMTVQYNDQTKNIHVDDIFEWDNETYRIVDVNRVGVHLFNNHGTLKLQAKKAEGGLHGYE